MKSLSNNTHTYMAKQGIVHTYIHAYTDILFCLLFLRVYGCSTAINGYQFHFHAIFVIVLTLTHVLEMYTSDSKITDYDGGFRRRELSTKMSSSRQSTAKTASDYRKRRSAASSDNNRRRRSSAVTVRPSSTVTSVVSSSNGDEVYEFIYRCL